MFNLIKRDLIIHKWQILLIVPFIILFIITASDTFFVFFIASIFIPFNALAVDEKKETNILLNSLPYTRRQIIASRYLGAILYMFLSIGVASIALFVMNRPFTMTDILIGSGTFLLFSAITFPLFYIFKSGYISSIVLISGLILLAIGPPIVSLFAEHFTVITDFINQFTASELYIGVSVFIIIIYTASWLITNTIYQRKAF
ncbi:ABC-2 transporter permease [Virgibacillus sp. YIM 98842]|uniref:ABC-2 transporter permease n=1 Tax=Virgibacillus sp. YIM 98842 TaxID=2663533 RepID=UPI0013DC440D|nr:ABC-2 transporter permease [Virgibacillus sp. YIM 98842]